MISADSPPFIEADLTIVVRVDFIKELVELRIGDCKSSSLESKPEFFLVESTVMILVYALEQLPQLSFCMLYKDSELIELYTAITGGVDSLEDVAQEVVCVFERVVDLLETFLQANDVYLAYAGRVERLP